VQEQNVVSNALRFARTARMSSARVQIDDSEGKLNDPPQNLCTCVLGPIVQTCGRSFPLDNLL